MGDLEFFFGNVERSIEVIYLFVCKLFEEKKVFIFLGGEYLISFFLIKVVVNLIDEELYVFYFDVYVDMREEYFGEKFLYVIVMRRVGELIGFKNIY